MFILAKDTTFWTMGPDYVIKFFWENIFLHFQNVYIVPWNYHYGSLYRPFKCEAIYLLFISEAHIQIFFAIILNIVNVHTVPNVPKLIGNLGYGSILENI
jgi:hypothetical protein